MRRLSIALAAVALVTAGCSASYGGTSNGTGTDCGMNDESLTLTAGKVTASATAACQTAPQTHAFTLQLNLTNAGTTETLGTKQSTEIPPASGLTLSISHFCLPGTWTLIISAAGRSSDGTPFDFSDRKTLAGVSLSDCKGK